jgi:polyisoprenoid-binding protein YceI
MKHLTKLLFVLILTAMITPQSWGKVYIIDASHSSVSFKIKHLFSKIRGSFDEFSGTFSFDPSKPTLSTTNIDIKAQSINTKVTKRDDHLRAEDFFHVKKFPNLKFTSTKYEVIKKPKKQGGRHKARMHGLLALRGVTKEVILDVSYNGIGKDPWGNTAISFEATGKINRKDFGLAWNKAVETGGFLVGNEVEIEILVEANPQPEKPTLPVKTKQPKKTTPSVKTKVPVNKLPDKANLN